MVVHQVGEGVVNLTAAGGAGGTAATAACVAAFAFAALMSARTSAVRSGGGCAFLACCRVTTMVGKIWSFR
jgi:hypothetical protein